MAIVFVFAGGAIVGVFTEFVFDLGSPKSAVRGLVYAALVVAIVGVWLLVAPDPFQRDDASDDAIARRRLVVRIALVTVVGMLAARLAFDAAIPPLARSALSVTILIVALTVIRSAGPIVRGLAARCSSASIKDAKAAGAGGGCVIWPLIGLAALTVLPRLAGGWGSLQSAMARVESMAIFFGSMAVVMALLSLAKPMKAVEAERNAALCGKRGPEPIPPSGS